MFHRLQAVQRQVNLFQPVRASGAEIAAAGQGGYPAQYRFIQGDAGRHVLRAVGAGERFAGTADTDGVDPDLVLSRQLADRRIFPAIDVTSSGTRKEEKLRDDDELKAVWHLRRVLTELNAIEAMDRLIDWLPEHIPAEESASIVHGDFRLDNMVLHPDEPRVIAVLDWELSTIGHPLADFTYHLMAWQMPDIGIGSAGLVGKDLPALGIPTSDEYVRAYCERTGRGGLDNAEFYFAFNFFRLAAILQGIAGRVRDGTAASAHAGQAERAVEPLADLGWEFAARA